MLIGRSLDAGDSELANSLEFHGYSDVILTRCRRILTDLGALTACVAWGD